MQIPIELESKAVNNWSVDDVSIWLSHNSIPQDCVNIIKGEEIDGMSITALDIPALKEIGITRFGPRVNTFNLINALIDHSKRDQVVRDNIAPMLTSPASSTKLTFSPHDSAQTSKIQNTNHLAEDTPPGLANSIHSTSNQYTEQFQNIAAPVENNSDNILATTFSRLENSGEQQNLPHQQEYNYPWSSQLDDSNNISQSLKLHEEIASANYNENIHSFHDNQTSDTTYQVLQAQKLLGVTLNDESNQQNDIEFQQASPSPRTTELPLSSRYNNEIFENSAEVSNDKYNRKYPYSRENSPEPYRDSYRSEDRKRISSDSYYSSKTAERSSSRRRGRYTETAEYSSPEYERKPLQNFKLSKFKEQSTYHSHKNYYEYNNNDRSSSYRDRSVDYNNDTRYNRNGDYDRRSFSRPDNYKNSRQSFSKPAYIDNNYKSTTAPPLKAPKRESQIFTPFANYSNTPVSIKPLAIELYPQQIEGVESLWKTIVESLSGDTLSPCKGLGKTGQVYTFLNTLRYYVRYSPDIIPDMLLPFKVLIVTPRFLKENWLNGFQTCANFEPYLKNQYVHLAIPNCLDDFHHKQRLRALQNWDKHGGIVIISHNLINEYMQATNYFDKQSRGLIFDQPGASLVFIDETRDLYEENNNFTSLSDKFNSQCLVYLDGL